MITVRMDEKNLTIEEYDLDDAVISSCLNSRTPQLRIYVPENICVVLGRGSKSEIELNIDACLKENISIFRRRGGGCAVVIDPGNVIVSVVLPATGWGQINEYFENISSWLIDGLAQCGLENVCREGYSDLVYGNRKIAGACMQRKRDYVFYSASLLYKPDISLLTKYLAYPPREPDYRKGREHPAFVTSICEIINCGTPVEFANELQKALQVLNFPQVT